MSDCIQPSRTACDAARVEARRPHATTPRIAFLAARQISLSTFLLIAFSLLLHFPALPDIHASDDGDKKRLTAEAYEQKALEHFYSAEFREAETDYKNAIAQQPENALYWDGLADSYLFQLLMAAGRLDSRLYSAANEFLENPTPPPNRALLAEMWSALQRGRSLAESQIRANAGDAVAHYALAVNYAIEAHYHLNLARKPKDALRVARKARDAAQRARQLDPRNSDANLILGGYEYAIGSVPFSFRWVLAVGGYSGSKKRGLALARDAMVNGTRTPVAAQALLAVAYGREKLYVDSRELFQRLLRAYPRNYLYQMEIARTYQLEKNLGAAIEVCKNVARKYEARAPGFEHVDAVRLYFQIATLLDEHNRPDEAAEYFQKLTRQQPACALHGKSYLWLGAFYRGRNEREKARAMYERAQQLPYAEIQKQATSALKKL